jgi:hypothetical protein
MKHPILHVKKGWELGSDQGAETDSTPAERTGRGSPRGPRRTIRRGWFTVVLLVVVGISALLVFRTTPRTSGERAALAGWEMVLRAMPYEGELLVGVTFVRSAASHGQTAGAAPTATVRFLVRETGEGLMLTETLIRSPITAGGRMRYSAGVKSVAAEVTIGAAKAYLAVTVKQSPNGG